MKKPQPSQRRLERQQHAALKTLFRTSEALGEKAFVRLRGEVTRSYFGKRKKKVKRDERDRDD